MRIIVSFICMAGLAASSLQPTAAIAQRASQQQQRSVGQQQQRDVRQITARIVDLRRVAPVGTEEDHLAAMVQVEDGRRLIVALGAAEKLNPLDLQAEDRVRVTGHMVQVRGRPLLVAHRIEANEQSVTVEHRQTHRDGLRTISCQLVQHRDIRMPGADEPMKVALIERSDGERVVANLGAASNFSDVDLQQGASIQVTGHTTQIHDSPVLVAHRVKAGDQTVQVEHQQMPAGERLYLKRRSGEVLQTRRINPPGLPEMVVARVKTDRGEMIANLGAAEGVSEADLQEGDPIELIGHEIRLHDRPIFIAHELRSGDQRVILDHRSLQRASAERRRNANSLSGTIRQIRQIEPPGQVPPMVSALIATPDGSTLAANLGLASRVDQLRLRRGDSVRMEGRFVQIHDSPLFIAHRIRSGDEVVEVVPRQRRVGNRGTQGQRPSDGQTASRQRLQSDRGTQRPGGLGVWLNPNDRGPGVQIIEVDPNSPAAEAGLRAGDRLITIGEQYVDTGEQVTEIISSYEPGATVRLVYRRDGQRRTATPELTTRTRALGEFDGSRYWDRGEDFDVRGQYGAPAEPLDAGARYEEDDYFDDEQYTPLLEDIDTIDTNEDGYYGSEPWEGDFWDPVDDDLIDDEPLEPDDDYTDGPVDDRFELLEDGYEIGL